MSTILIGSLTYAQQNPTGNPGNSRDWRRGGNLAAPPGLGGTNNIFGTMWNSPIYTYTNGVPRMKLNGRNTYQVNGFNAERNGYLLLGRSSAAQNPALFNNQSRGAYSVLHLTGKYGVLTQETGYRPWMQTGMTLTDNQDLAYFGLRHVGNENLFDKTETTITWTDNVGVGVNGPDDMVFRFTSAGAGNSSYSNDITSVTDLDGRHIARFTGDGDMGLGPNFGIQNIPGQVTNYVRPQSHLHMSTHGNTEDGLQITNQNGTNETVNDGLRLGIRPNRNAYLRQQENRPFIIQSDWNLNPGGINNGERMRITSLGEQGGNLPQPINPNNNITRVAISHRGNQPVTSPRSLMHLGYNTGGVGLAGTADGWRNWMDIGTFTSNGTDHMYFGLKQETGGVPNNDRMDAVINWGDNGGSNPLNGPDYLRFIFTETQTSTIPGNAPATSNNGLEVARFDPSQDINNNPANNHFGKLGVGDFTAANPTHKLHVKGNGRFEYIPDTDSAEYLILGNVVDNPDDLELRKLQFPNDPSQVLLGDGTWGTTNSSSGFALCNDNSGITDLTGDSKLNLNNNNLYFENNDQIGSNLIGVGYNCASPLIGKFNVYSDREKTNSYFYTNDGTNQLPVNDRKGVHSILDDQKSLNAVAIEGKSIQITGTTAETVGVRGIVDSKTSKKAIGVQGISLKPGYGGYFSADGIGIGQAAVGLRSDSKGSTSGNTGGAFYATQSSIIGGNLGVYARSVGANVHTGNTGLRAEAYGVNSINIGVQAQAYSGTSNYAIYAESPQTAPNSYAGWFQGNVTVTGTFTEPSDENLKENVAELENATDIINQLNAVTFDYKQTGQYEHLNLAAGNQYGMIAQEVEQILPDIIHNGKSPAEFDSLGNEIHPEMEFKTMNYEALIPILTKGIQEQNSVIEDMDSTIASKDSLINDLNDRLSNLENCLSNILPILCSMNQSMVQPTNDDLQERLEQTLNIELSNDENIVLNQNVPNPFAENTTITFSVPASVKDARIVFYDGFGKSIKTVEITDRGNGRINVFGSDLSKGVYSYTLIADGQVIATKRMVKQ